MSTQEPRKRRTRKEAIKAGIMRNNQRPPVPPVTLTSNLVTAFVELIVLLFIILVLTTSVNEKFSAEAAAETYFINLVNGNYKTAYKSFELEEDDFVNLDAFTTYAKQMNFENMSDCQVEKRESDSDDSDATNKTVSITYYYEGDENEHRYSVNMEKSGRKRLLFFDDWNVTKSAILCTDCEITVCDGAKLVIDGIEVDSAYINPEADSAEYYDTYCIPQIIQGNHVIEVSMDGMETIKESQYINSGSFYVSYTDMYCTEDTCKELQTLAVNNLYRIYDAALKGKSFDEIASIFTSNEDRLYYIQEDYNYLVEDFASDESTQINAITFNNIAAYGSTNSTYVELSFKYVIDCMTEDWWTGSMKQDTIQGSDYYTFEFAKENGEWVQLDLSCGYLY